jgi:SAM-dependent methyltransferase
MRGSPDGLIGDRPVDSTGASPPVTARRLRLRTLRLRLPQPWASRLGEAAHLWRLRDRPVRDHFREERLIEELVRRGEQRAGVGEGLSERVVEIPWVLRRLPSDSSRVLDVGTAFAPLVYKRLLLRIPARVEIVDLSPVELPGIPAHVADVCALPLPDETFDAVSCISTLEHIGLDNTVYGIAERRSTRDDVAALRELGRVARRDGRVLVTVPGGERRDFPGFRQYDVESFLRAADAAGLYAVELETFVHRPGTGWLSVGPDELSGRTYGEDAPWAAGLICATLRR